MRLSRAIKLVTLSGFLSTLVTIGLWSVWGKRPGEEDELETSRRRINYILTDYQSDRGSNPAGGDGVAGLGENDSNSVNALLLNVAPGGSHSSLQFEPIDCNINDERTVPCRKEGDHVYLPFDFVKEYFEVFGEVERSGDGSEHLDFHHANSIVHPPRPTYTPDSMFMAFDHYNVENRDRVKCVTASEGVPITTQWSKDGYHYPIQIAQFALSHHAKHLVDLDTAVSGANSGPNQQRPQRVVLEDGEGDRKSAKWVLSDKKSTIKTVTESAEKSGDQNNHLLEFNTDDSYTAKGISISPKEKSFGCFLLDVKFATNGSITVVVEAGKDLQIKIHYVFTSTFISSDGKGNIYYGMGTGRKGQWMRLVRNLKFDLLKGLLVKMKMDKAKLYPMTKVLEIQLHGHGWLDNLTISRSVHMEQFYDAADWLVRHQDQRGGWPIMVQRRVVVGVLELAPGWYSAMGQGQAMSVLVRAYLDSKDKKYLSAAVKALNLFQVDSADGGVRARFFSKYDWYEEYPTTPSSFVLNGFIYSLLGLYDLKETATDEDKLLAEKIYNSGMTSLKNMIGMYDSGVGTFYDLRHISAGIEPNRARWDYHTTHINQLLQLMIIDDDEIFKKTVQRWLGYLKGKRSRHN